jgi:hypothetical protein
MTASEIAMGRYMRAPDHSAADFDTAFAEFASPEDKKPDEAGAAGATGGDAAAGGEGDGSGAGAASGDGSGGAAGDSGDGAGAAAAGAADAGATGGEAAAAGADAAAGATGDGKGGDGAGAGEGAADGADAGAAGAAAAGADAPAAGAGDAAASPDADAILAGLRKLVGQPEAPAAGAEAAAAAPGADTPKPTYTDEEQTFLTQYEKDWGDVAKGEALKRRAEYQALLDHVFKQVANFVKPIQETAEALAQRTFTSDVRSAVPDYSDQLRADVMGWVKSQPTYLQVAYNHVIEEGTVDEVKDLVDRYRTATGKAAPKPAGAGGAAPKPADKGNELSDEAKKAAAALAPVDSKRSGVTAPGDPSDFEDAWKQAAADLG